MQVKAHVQAGTQTLIMRYYRYVSDSKDFKGPQWEEVMQKSLGLNKTSHMYPG